jgi:kinesin family protein C2/C3
MKNEVLVGKLNDLKNNISDINNENIDSILHGKDVFTYSVNVSMVEIYNEQLRDLLVEGPPSGANLEIRQAADGSVHIPGLNTVRVNSIDDVMTVFARGSAIRATSATNVNEHSSRSHSILVVEVTTCLDGSSPVKAKLFLVDLAGSERVAKSGVTGTALTEAKYINKSLSALGDVMEALDQKAKHIPYRNSKLTHFLQDSLGGNSKTMMIVTTCPTDYSAEETLFTLQFAARVRNINIGPAKRNFNTKNLEEAVKLLKAEIGSSQKNAKKMEDQIAELKRENKRLLEKNNEIKIRAFDELKRINSITSPGERVIKDRVKSSPNDTFKTPKPIGHASPVNDSFMNDNTDIVNKVKDRQSIGSRIPKVPIPATRTPPFKGAEIELETPKLSSASLDSNSSNHKEAPSSSASKINSRLKPRSEIQLESTPNKKSVVKEEVSESNTDNIKTTIDLATRRRIAERSAVTLQKHKERMDARRKQHDEVLVAVRR